MEELSYPPSPPSSLLACWECYCLPKERRTGCRCRCHTEEVTEEFFALVQKRHPDLVLAKALQWAVQEALGIELMLGYIETYREQNLLPALERSYGSGR